MLLVKTPTAKGVHFFTLEKQLGFYYENIGYQRKGMNQKFWHRFCSGLADRFTRKEDFEYALDCVDLCWKNDTEEEVAIRRHLFRQSFVKQYESNKSWMDLSY